MSLPSYGQNLLKAVVELKHMTYLKDEDFRLKYGMLLRHIQFFILLTVNIKKINIPAQTEGHKSLKQ